jgi:hypothetical protein
MSIFAPHLHSSCLPPHLHRPQACTAPEVLPPTPSSAGSAMHSSATPYQCWWVRSPGQLPRGTTWPAGLATCVVPSSGSPTARSHSRSSDARTRARSSSRPKVSPFSFPLISSRSRRIGWILVTPIGPWKQLCSTLFLSHEKLLC